MKLSKQSKSQLQMALRQALDTFRQELSEPALTDIHLQPIQGSGEVCILNDDDAELAKTVIPEFAGYQSADFYSQVGQPLRQVLEQARADGLFQDARLVKPYTLVLVDEERETVCDLMIMDDEETLLLGDTLLKGLDEELDAFLAELLDDESI